MENRELSAPLLIACSIFKLEIYAQCHLLCVLFAGDRHGLSGNFHVARLL
jgi:hypothetical protein